ASARTSRRTRAARPGRARRTTRRRRRAGSRAGAARTRAGGRRRRSPDATAVPGCLARRSRLGLVHRAAQAQRPHVGPDLLDIAEALLLGPGLADAAPAQRQLAVLGPDRVL